MKKLTYILLLSVLAFSCQREDIIDGTAVSFYPTVISTGAEQDENTYILNLATSQFINGSAEVTIQVDMTADGVLSTVPAMDGNTITVPFNNTNEAQIMVTIENDATPEDYTATFRIVSASSGIQPSSTNKYTLFVRDTDSLPIILEEFDDCPDSEYLSFVSVEGDQFWDCTNFGRIINGSNTPGLRMNGFVSGSGAQENEDWVISEPLNLLAETNVSASFYSDLAFGGPELEFRVSTNYDGNGDPSSATWTTLDAIYDTDTGFDNWTFSGNISLNDYISATTSVALVYISSAAEGAAQWTIDDFMVSTFQADASNGGSSPVLDVPFETDFESCSDFSIPSGFVEEHATGAKDDTGWGCREKGVDGSRAVQVNGFGGTETGTVDAWLITEARYDFRNLPGAQLTFDVKSEGPASGLGQLRVYYSDFYLGGDPTLYEWTEIESIASLLPSKGSDTYTEVSVSVPGVAGTRSFFAFRFDGATQNNSATYEIDNFKIEELEGIKYTLPFTDDFETCEEAEEFNIPTNWIEENVPGSKTDRGWGCREFGRDNSWAPRASAFGGEDGTDDAWLITNGKLDLTGVSSATLVFWIESRFNGPGDLEVKYSTNYSGSGDPTQATWTDLTDVTAQLPPDGSQTFTEITSDLSGAAGQEIHLAFRYFGGTASASIGLTLDDLSVTGN